MRAFYRRQFLNTEEDGGTAFIKAYVDEAEDSGSGATHFDAEFTVSDCNRQVTLDFGVWGTTTIANMRQKIAKFRRAVVAFELALVAQLDAVEK